MKVKELIELLQGLPEDLNVLMSSDAEGNDFNTFSGDLTVGRKVKSDSPWERGFTTEEDWAEENDAAYPGNDSVVLWP